MKKKNKDNKNKKIQIYYGQCPKINKQYISLEKHHNMISFK